MEKMWAGRFEKQLDDTANDFNSSIRVDSKMFKQDICGSVAHANMLAAKGIISAQEKDMIVEALCEISQDIESGKLPIDMQSEDIHMFVEAQLTSRIGDVGKKLHTARSRNDEVALDIRLYLRERTNEIISLTRSLIEVITDKAQENADVIMPGYTHLQRAQPITFGHHLMAYAMMFLRDIDRLKDAVRRMNYSPLGCCALAGTTYDTDRNMTAQALGFDGITLNSIDGVSDRDFCLELAAAFSTEMMHLSRFSEEIILWASWEFKFVELDDSFSTGSSIMPQKKNPDMAELVRGKTGRVYGNMLTLYTMMKGLPLAYNKDMQEDKEAIFDSLESLEMCLKVFAPMLDTMSVCKDNMRNAAAKGFINATDLADYLVKKGMPFRSAYKLVGEIVCYCVKQDKVLEDLPIDVYKNFSEEFSDDLYEAINLENCAQRRTSQGGTCTESVLKQIMAVKEELKNG